MNDDARLEVGRCRECGRSLLISIDDGRPFVPAPPRDSCLCGGTEFERLSVDRALSGL